jgi:hypothetical protein
MATDPNENTKPNDESKSNPNPPKPAKTKPVRLYEVRGTINLGRLPDGRPDVRTGGATVREDELLPADIKALLASGEIADNNAPVAPSLAEKFQAIDALVDVALQVEALGRDGNDYLLAGQTFAGLSDFRARATVEQLKAAIVAKFNEE